MILSVMGHPLPLRVVVQALKQYIAMEANRINANSFFIIFSFLIFFSVQCKYTARLRNRQVHNQH
jgi:hypothetical protein